ncbi:MAG: LPD5 domain-containing protein, partial [Muribaculaceae bacterium]
AESHAKAVEIIKAFIASDSAGRAAMASVLQAEYERALSSGDAISPLAFAYKVIERAGLGNKSGYKPVDLYVKRYSSGSYSVSAGKGSVYIIGKNLEDAIATRVAALQIKNGVSDIELPVSLFRVKGTKRKLEGTGKYQVDYRTGNGMGSFSSKVFASREEAEAFAAQHKGSSVGEQTAFGDFGEWTVEVINPASQTIVGLGLSFGSKAEANAYIEEHLGELSEIACGKIFKEEGTEKKGAQYFEIHKDYRNGDYFIACENWVISTHGTLEEAQKECSKLNEEYRKLLEERRNMVYFSPKESERKGMDWRKGKDATPEMFMDAFGFRGVQFGNWTNGKDRQEALNQAYDAFMDLSELLGKSPRAMSLNGELGLSFGARGSGSALAHYESQEVVINLTKTKGAGSLAHEWWHALDNYLSRKAGVASGFATEMPNTQREELDADIKSLMRAVYGTSYGRRCGKMSAYWRSVREVTARLFAEYVSERIKGRGGENAFLSRGIDLAALERFKEANWRLYQKRVSRKVSRYGSDADYVPMTHDEFINSAEALEGYPMPLPSEVKELTPYLDRLLEDIKEDAGGAMFHKAAESGIETGELLPDERVLVEGLADVMRGSGIEVELSEEGQRVLDSLNGRLAGNGEEGRGTRNEVSGNGSGDIEVTWRMPKSNVDLSKAEHSDERHYSAWVNEAGVNEARRMLLDFERTPYVDYRRVFEEPTLDDYHIATVADFRGVRSDDVSADWERMKGSGRYEWHRSPLSRSEYLVDRESGDIYRRSDHWGRVSSCYWSLDGSDVKGRDVIGVANISDFRGRRGTGKMTENRFPFGRFAMSVRRSIANYEDVLRRVEMTDENRRRMEDALSSLRGMESRLSESGYVPSSGELSLMKVYHGSGSDFDAFDFAHMGEGEGSQAYGWGGYVTETEGIGRLYTAVSGDGGNEKGSQGRVLYTVEVPDDNGRNYLHWEKSVGKERAERVRSALYDYLLSHDEEGMYEDGYSRGELKKELGVIDGGVTGGDLYGTVSGYLGGDRAASEFLGSLGVTGVSYPNQGGERNYVIFKEGDMEIRDKARFFRTPKGEVYGFVMGDKIYLDPKVATSESAVHEYAHLWAAALRRGNSAEWANVIGLMKGTRVW